MNYLFSIIIPCFNSGLSIDKCLKFVLFQKFKNYEIIIVDDGSTDNTKELINKYLCDNVRYFYQSNSGVSKARNFGSINSKGEYLIFLDSDDYVNSNWLLDFSNILFQKKPDIVVCKSINENNKQSNGFLAGTFCVRKNIFNSIGGYDEYLKFGENTDLKWRLDLIGASFYFIKNANIIYVQSVSGGGKNKKNQLDFFHHMLIKHDYMLSKNSRWIQILYQNAGVTYFQLNMYKKGLNYLWIGFLKNPKYIKSFLRFIKYFLKYIFLK